MSSGGILLPWTILGRCRRARTTYRSSDVRLGHSASACPSTSAYPLQDWLALAQAACRWLRPARGMFPIIDDRGDLGAALRGLSMTASTQSKDRTSKNATSARGRTRQLLDAMRSSNRLGLSRSRPMS